MHNRIAKVVGSLLLGLLVLWFILSQLQGQELAFETIAQRDVINYREEKPALLVIVKATEVDDLSKNIFAEDRELAVQLHTLDYDRSFAVLVLQGQKRIGGYSVIVQQIRRQGNQVTVKAQLVEPGLGSRIFGAFTSPYHLVAVFKQGAWGQPIRFVLVGNGNIVAEATHVVP